jgi:hypothetical protein
LILDNGMSSYAIEAKRPQKRKNIVAQFDRGSQQIKDYGLPGGVLVDVTDALRDVPGSHLAHEVHNVAVELYDRVFEIGRGYRPGMSHVILIGVVARVSWRSVDKTESAMVQVHSASTFGVFGTVKNTLSHRRAKWMRAVLETGYDQLSRTLIERARLDGQAG